MVKEERGIMAAMVAAVIGTDLVKGKMRGLSRGLGNILRVGRRIGTRAVLREEEQMAVGIGDRILAEVMRRTGTGRGTGHTESVSIGKGVIVLRLIAIIVLVLVVIETGIVIVNVKGAEDLGINLIDIRLRLILVKGLSIGFRLILVVVVFLVLPVTGVILITGVIQGRETMIVVISHLPRPEHAIPLERIRIAHLLVTTETGIETEGCLRPVHR